MKYDTVDDKIIIYGMTDFEPIHVFECGQCFRWNAENDGSYTGVAKGKIINVKSEGKLLIFSNTNQDDFNNVWYDYFDLGRDYGKIKKALNNHREISEAIKFGHGLRILRQDEWETLITFIISTNKTIPLIKKSVEQLSFCFGKKIGRYREKEYFDFPKPEDIFSLNTLDIRSCKVGYRDQYIKEASEYVVNHSEWINSIRSLNDEQAIKELKKIKGVGDKVAHCVLLFSLGRYEAFPVDVWISRVMNHLYTMDKSSQEINKMALSLFGEYSGFAQQYLFYYAREVLFKNIKIKNEEK
jgi:N-glycosylase/DNA lyase